MAGRMKKFSENTSTITEVMDSNTLNFSQTLSFHDYFFLGGGTPASFGSALASLGQYDLLYSSVAVKRNSWSLRHLPAKTEACKATPRALQTLATELIGQGGWRRPAHLLLVGRPRLRAPSRRRKPP